MGNPLLEKSGVIFDYEFEIGDDGQIKFVSIIKIKVIDYVTTFDK